jgi:hypothetical protein
MLHHNSANVQQEIVPVLPGIARPISSLLLQKPRARMLVSSLQPPVSLQISKLEYKQMLPNSPILFFHNEQQHLKENDDF